MKPYFALPLLVLASLFSSAAFAGHEHEHGATPAVAAARKTSMAEGVVMKIDTAKKGLTLSHGPIERLGMPAMTMVFKLKPPATLNHLRVGDKVLFIAEIIDGVLTVVHLEPVR